MFDVLTTINWFSVLLAFLGYVILGTVWYLFLFPKSYRISLGRDPHVNASEAPIYIIGPTICALIVTLSCTVLMYALNISSYGEAIQFTLIVGIGFLFTNTVNIGINPNIPKPFLYGMITGMYHLVGMVIVNTILFAMK
ncbi:uncharacterized protein DUF1761 [Pedobacter psychrotolerans]|uniref:Uncharacterized protein DUF1761 n=1 Tax=Pedobacter psychrotolerans TaxID=1843235 RepID=A0A4R2HLZ5_9SPHI|nr:DUF1761 domain-containing protein [Pedobacter psychrotolerans]TCO31118.1 uncharacterized protein DUF1761 [Pedobacter psychrotolerans]GGE42100.1 hypothetical protein GCM10011413_04970 [Pedobacter psychrotolerans]